MRLSGLSTREAEKRLEEYGKNEIKRFYKPNPLKILISQFTSPLIVILIIAAIVSSLIGFLPGQEASIFDTILILLIVFISGLSGFFQDYKAEKTIEALQRMSVPKAKVIRDGKEMQLDATEIVPGDLILIESGDVVPADARLVESFDLRVDESILTGESISIKKEEGDEVFMNTFINTGSAKAIVLRTGMRTRVGAIARKLQSLREEKTPFQRELSRLSKKIAFGIIGIVLVILFVSLFRYSLYLSFLTAISLAVAAIPEGLPAVVVLTLSVGARVMSKKNALIRRLSVSESMGAVDIICTDKTGTLTKNEMTVTRLFFDNRVIYISKLNKVEKIKQLFTCGLLCNNSSVGYDKDGNKKYIGDQTEIALRKVSEKFGLEKESLEKIYRRVSEISFSSKRKMMSVVYSHNNKYFVYSKGAPEVLIEKCDRIYEKGKIRKITNKDKEKILKQNKKFASSALRVLGFAYKEVKKLNKEVEANLIWLGLQAMIDPPRKEVKNALQECRNAGIRVIMLTGDNPLTARAIAKEIGLESRGIMQGSDIDKLSDSKLEEKLKRGVNIFARVSPFHKLRILEILKKENRVAMTGDGVNDALALKKADVGISMGIRGTDVAKEASDIILLDDNFVTIIGAIKEGRRIFDNIRKFINYLLTCNLAEVMVLFLATLLLTLKEPILLPIHLLWINLLTDGLPALALGIDPARADIMKDPPRKKDEPIVDKRLSWIIVLIGFEMTFMLIATFLLILPLGFEKARTTLFMGFVFYEFIRVASIRHQEKLNWLSNKWLLFSLICSFLLQLVIIYSPINRFFHVVSLGFYPWIVLVIGALVGYFLAILITKIVIDFVVEDYSHVNEKLY